MMPKARGPWVFPLLVGLVIPTGYSFNLDGTSIYLTMATIFLAQATNTSLTLPEQISLLAVLLLTSKGAATVAGGGFITWPQRSRPLDTSRRRLTLLLGIDRSCPKHVRLPT